MIADRRIRVPLLLQCTLHSADLAGLTRELQRIRCDGFAFDNEEAEKGVSCIGAGIRDDKARLMAGFPCLPLQID
jgi:DNA-binding IclR family transcriptional regulator